MKKKLLAMLLVLSWVGVSAQAAESPVVRLTTNRGVIEVELYPDKAPATVENVLGYVKSGFYTGTIFHRVIPGFMIQGGGFAPGLHQKPTRAPIKNEADNGLKNVAGSIAMARTMDPNSATAQFFINTVDNPALDFKSKTPQGWGYCVFGKVTKGMDIVKQIELVPTVSRGPYQNVPRDDVIIQKAELVQPAARAPAKESNQK